MSEEQNKEQSQPYVARDFVGERLLAEMRDRVGVIQKLYESAGDKVEREIHEDDFRRYFLPYFSGQQKTTPEVREYWITVAGTALNAVNIVGQHNQVVAVVPPLVDTSSIVAVSKRFLEKKGGTVDDVMQDATIRATAMPKVAQNNLASTLAQRFKVNAAPSEALKAQWQKLFDYFGVKMTVAGQSSVQNTTDSGESEFDYTVGDDDL